MPCLPAGITDKEIDDFFIQAVRIILFQVSEAKIRALFDFTAVLFLIANDDFAKRGLAAAIAANHANLLIRVKGDTDILKDDLRTISLLNVAKL